MRRNSLAKFVFALMLLTLPSGRAIAASSPEAQFLERFEAICLSNINDFKAIMDWADVNGRRIQGIDAEAYIGEGGRGLVWLLSLDTALVLSNGTCAIHQDQYLGGALKELFERKFSIEGEAMTNENIGIEMYTVRPIKTNSGEVLEIGVWLMAREPINPADESWLFDEGSTSLTAHLFTDE